MPQGTLVVIVSHLIKHKIWITTHHEAEAQYIIRHVAISKRHTDNTTMSVKAWMLNQGLWVSPQLMWMLSEGMWVSSQGMWVSHQGIWMSPSSMLMSPQGMHMSPQGMWI